MARKYLTRRVSTYNLILTGGPVKNAESWYGERGRMIRKTNFAMRTPLVRTFTHYAVKASNHIDWSPAGRGTSLAVGGLCRSWRLLSSTKEAFAPKAFNDA